MDVHYKVNVYTPYDPPSNPTRKNQRSGVSSAALESTISKKMTYSKDMPSTTSRGQRINLAGGLLTESRAVDVLVPVLSWTH